MPARTTDAVVDHINSLVRDRPVRVGDFPKRFGDDSFGVRLLHDKEYEGYSAKSRRINVSITGASESPSLEGVQVLLCNGKGELIDVEPLQKSQRKPNEHWCQFTGIPLDDLQFQVKLMAREGLT